MTSWLIRRNYILLPLGKSIYVSSESFAIAGKFSEMVTPLIIGTEVKAQWHISGIRWSRTGEVGTWFSACEKSFYSPGWQLSKQKPSHIIFVWSITILHFSSLKISNLWCTMDRNSHYAVRSTLPICDPAVTLKPMKQCKGTDWQYWSLMYTVYYFQCMVTMTL
jgi:hypothetical protein